MRQIHLKSVPYQRPSQGTFFALPCPDALLYLALSGPALQDRTEQGTLQGIQIVYILRNRIYNPRKTSRFLLFSVFRMRYERG